VGKGTGCEVGNEIALGIHDKKGGSRRGEKGGRQLGTENKREVTRERVTARGKRIAGRKRGRERSRFLVKAAFDCQTYRKWRSGKSRGAVNAEKNESCRAREDSSMRRGWGNEGLVGKKGGRS